MPDIIVYLRIDASVVVRAKDADEAQEAVLAMSTERIVDAASFESWTHKIDSTEAANPDRLSRISPIDAAREIDARTLGDDDA